jgi:hypothetical protein
MGLRWLSHLESIREGYHGSTATPVENRGATKMREAVRSVCLRAPIVFTALPALLGTSRRFGSRGQNFESRHPRNLEPVTHLSGSTGRSLGNHGKLGDGTVEGYGDAEPQLLSASSSAPILRHHLRRPPPGAVADPRFGLTVRQGEFPRDSGACGRGRYVRGFEFFPGRRGSPVPFFRRNPNRARRSGSSAAGRRRRW